MPRRRPIEVNDYPLPEKVWLADGRIFWTRADIWEPGPYPRATVTPDVFKRFLNLNSATDQEILAFAQEYGPLTTFRDVRDIRVRLAEEKRVGETVGESTDTWRRLARVAWSILQVSRDHRDGKTGKPEHWAILGADGVASRPLLEGRRNLEIEMIIIAAEVNRWMRAGAVAPLLNIINCKYKVVLESQKLRGGLAIQLLQQLGGDRLAACSGCHQFYFPLHAPRTGQDNFCEICQTAGVPVARAKHRKYLRDRAKGKKKNGRTIKTKRQK